MIRLSHYTNKDRRLLFWVMVPFTIILNAFIFGSAFFLHWPLFVLAMPVTLLVMSGSFIVYGYMAALLRQRFPSDQDFFKRTMILIMLFLIVSALILFGLFGIYYATGLLASTDNEHSFTWAFVITGILNIFLTFLREGVSRFEGWKANQVETEQLKSAYKQSQLMSLKSHVNPHFLFNSLNSLSGLIQENTTHAEKFLDEMSKVYRYMLRNEDEQLVPLSTELQFIQSYFSLLKVRYTDAIVLDIQVNEKNKENLLPPLSLQVIFENALFQNKTEKNSPLHLHILSGDGGEVIVVNNIQPRVMAETTDHEAGLDNLVKKYRLLASQAVTIEDNGQERKIVLPLYFREGGNGMKLVKATRVQWYSFMASMPLIDLGLNLILFNTRVFNDYRIWLVSFPLIWCVGLLTWYAHVLYDNWAQQKFPELNQSKKRIIIKCLVVFLVMSPSIILIFILYDEVHLLDYSLKPGDLQKGVLVGFAVNLIFLTLWEAMYIMEKHKESLGEKEIILQMSLQQEFEVLKSQVNPHFLFNCFNTLSSLIVEDPKRAEVFLDELSKVYRYLLRNNEAGLSTLKSELHFIESYFQLLKTRHGEAVQFQVEADKRYDNYLLPSLSLQLLVENAVKHNVLSKNKPLVIEIFTTAGNKLVVNNNLQRRTVKGPSNKIGLDNIKHKYDLLMQKGFQVMEEGKNFTVVLPLIWNNSKLEQQWMPVGVNTGENKF